MYHGQLLRSIHKILNYLFYKPLKIYNKISFKHYLYLISLYEPSNLWLHQNALLARFFCSTAHFSALIIKSSCLKLSCWNSKTPPISSSRQFPTEPTLPDYLPEQSLPPSNNYSPIAVPQMFLFLLYH